MDTVLGVDACRTGWVGIALSRDTVTAHLARTIGALAEAAGPVSVIAIDIPIGLPERGQRQADTLARDFLGDRRSSVFMTPVRATLAIPKHSEASDVNREHTGQGMSIQAFSLLPRIREVDDWLPKAPCRVVEVHPEVSFTQLADEPLLHSKKTWAGAEQRRTLLEKAGISLPSELGEAGQPRSTTSSTPRWRRGQHAESTPPPLSHSPTHRSGSAASRQRSGVEVQWLRCTIAPAGT